MLEAKEAGTMEKLTSFFGKIAFTLIGIASAVLLASLVDLRISSSLLRLWITSQLIILVIWKFSADITTTPSPYHYLEQLDYLPAAAAADSPEETDWYSSECSPPAASAQDVDSPAADAVKNEAADAATTVREESTSMDDAWKAILEGTGLWPVLTKCETWEGRGSAEAERAVAALRRSDMAVLLRHNDEDVGPAAAAGKRRRKKKKSAEEEEQGAGWRRRERLVVSQDELFQRVETFIKKHHDNLRLQRQESEQRRLVLESLYQ